MFRDGVPNKTWRAGVPAAALAFGGAALRRRSESRCLILDSLEMPSLSFLGRGGERWLELLQASEPELCSRVSEGRIGLCPRSS